MIFLRWICAAYFGENSDLYNKLVIQEQKVRSIGADSYTTRDPYLISVEASLVDATDFGYIRKEMERVLEEAKSKPIDGKILQETKMNFRNSAIMSIDNPTAIAQNLSHFTWVSGISVCTTKLLRRILCVLRRNIFCRND